MHCAVFCKKNRIPGRFIVAATPLFCLADHSNHCLRPRMFISTPYIRLSNRFTMFILFILFYSLHKVASTDVTSEDIQFLNDLPLDKLIKLKSSLQQLVLPTEYDNVTATTPTYLEKFGAQAMAIKGPPIKRGDYEGVYKKGEYSKISNIFSMSVTTLAFLAFGGYLLCLIVQAVKQKQVYSTGTVVQQPTTFLVSAGIKKRPQHQLSSSYGRRKRQTQIERSLREIDIPPEELFSVLLRLCEGYAKWSERYGHSDVPTPVKQIFIAK